MKFCSHCGKELADDAVFCSACGKQVQQIPAPAPQVEPPQPKSSVLANCAFVLAFLCPLVGAILGLIGITYYGFVVNKSEKVRCILTLPISFIMLYVWLFASSQIF